MGGETETGREPERKMRGGQGPVKREHTDWAHVVLLVSAAVYSFYQNPKGRTVQMPEHKHSLS